MNQRVFLLSILLALTAFNYVINDNHQKSMLDINPVKIFATQLNHLLK